MEHKNKRTMMEFWDMHPKLKLIVCYANWWLVDNYNQELLITEIDRSKYEVAYFYDNKISSARTSVHMFNRGLDARMLKPVQLNHDLCDQVNKVFPYDKNRPHLKTAIFHGGTAKHIHFQVPASPTPVHNLVQA